MIARTAGQSRSSKARIIWWCSEAGVVRRLDRHLHVVGVALLERGRGDPDELTPGLQLRDRARADVEHGLVQAADELVRDRRERTAVGDLALDALRHDL